AVSERMFSDRNLRDAFSRDFFIGTPAQQYSLQLLAHVMSERQLLMIDGVILRPMPPAACPAASSVNARMVWRSSDSDFLLSFFMGRRHFKRRARLAPGKRAITFAADRPRGQAGVVRWCHQ